MTKEIKCSKCGATFYDDGWNMCPECDSKCFSDNHSAECRILRDRLSAQAKLAPVKDADESRFCLSQMPGDYWYCTKPRGHAGNHSCNMLDFMP